MLTRNHVKTLERLFQIFPQPPTIVLEEGDNDAILIDHGFLTILPTEITVKSIVGDVKVPGFSLEITVTGPGNGYDIAYDVDTVALAEDRNFHEIAIQAVVRYAEHLAKNLYDDLVTENYAEDLKEEQEQIDRAELEGYVSDEKDENPYVYPIEHFQAWEKGRKRRQGEIAESRAVTADIWTQFRVGVAERLSRVGLEPA